MRRLWLSLIVLATLFATVPAAAQQSVTVLEDLWVTDSRVRATALSGNTLYIGGDFTYVGPNTGHGAEIDAVSGTVDRAVARIDGTVSAVAPDGVGGWFVGGLFSRVGSLSRTNLAHLLSDGSVDTAWAPQPNGHVLDLAVSGGMLYVGGEFTSVSGQPRNRLAAVNGATGEVTGWNPGANATVRALATQGTTIYAGGDFTSVGGQTRRALVALNQSGTPTSWNPSLGNLFTTYSLATSADTVYAGTVSVGSSLPQNFIAALDAATAATRWSVNSNGQVRALANAGARVFVGGTFTSLVEEFPTGVQRSGLADLDATTGAVGSFNPNPNVNLVLALHASGTTLYVGGRFTTIAGQPRRNIAAFDLGGLQFTGWNPGTGGDVNALAEGAGNIFAGGEFTSAGGVERNFLAALDLTTGEATPFNPNLNGSVTELELSGPELFVAGGFTQFLGDTRLYLAALTVADQQLTAFNPSGVNIPPYHALAVSGSRVFVGGGFSKIGSTSRLNAAAFSRTTGALTNWRPDPNLDVRAITLSGNTVYLGGEFTTVRGVPRSRIAAVNTRNGQPTSWNPGADGRVETITVAGSAVYAGGFFLNAGGQPRTRVAGLDVATGAVTPFNPGASDLVRTIAVSGPNVYIGGDFVQLGGASRFYLGAVNAATGAVTSWDPHVIEGIDANATGRVISIEVSPAGDEVFVGGNYVDIASSGHANIAALSPST